MGPLRRTVRATLAVCCTPFAIACGGVSEGVASDADRGGDGAKREGPSSANLAAPGSADGEQAGRAAEGAATGSSETETSGAAASDPSGSAVPGGSPTAIDVAGEVSVAGEAETSDAMLAEPDAMASMDADDGASDDSSVPDDSAVPDDTPGVGEGATADDGVDPDVPEDDSPPVEAPPRLWETFPESAAEWLWFDAEEMWGPQALAVDSDGSFVVTGRALPSEDYDDVVNNGEAFTSKYNSSGELVWTHEIVSPNTIEGVAVALDSMGNAIIAIRDTYDGSQLAKYSPSGQLLWIVPLEPGEAQVPSDLLVDESDQILVASEGATLMTFDPNGDRSSVLSLDSGDDESIGSLAFGKNGEILMSGSMRPGADPEEDRRGWIGATSLSGELLWSDAVASGSLGGGLGAVVVDADGNAIVSGASFGGNNGDTADLGPTFLLGYTPLGEPTIREAVSVEGLEHVYDMTQNSRGELVVLSGYFLEEEGERWDGYLSICSPSGEYLRGMRLNSGEFVDGYHIAINEHDDIVIVGYTGRAGERSFVARLQDP